MFNMNINLRTVSWNICTPTLYRYLPSKYVEDFFLDGTIRLSSLEYFHRNKDEQKGDKGEGIAMAVINSEYDGGQAAKAWVIYSNVYVLSTTMVHKEDFYKKFKSDAFISIKETTAFGVEVARQIPDCIAAFEGPCIYQDRRIVLRKISLDLNQFRDKKNPDIMNEEALKQLIFSNTSYYPAFIKDKSFSEQMEYRFVWITKSKADEQVFLKVPEAIQYCERKNEVTE